MSENNAISRRFAKLGSIYFVGNILSSLISVLLVPLYTSFLTPSDFGMLSLIAITVELLSLFVCNPMVAGLKRYFYFDSYLEKQGLLTFNLFLTLVAKSVVISTLFYFLSNKISLWLFSDYELTRFVQLYSLILLLNPISYFLQNLVRIKEKALYMVFTNVSSSVLTIIIIYSLLTKGYGIYGVLYGLLFKAAYNVTVLMIEFLKVSKFEISLGLCKKPLLFGYPLVISGLSQILFSSGDRFLIKFLDSVRAVGIYDFGYKISAMLNMIVGSPVTQSLAPLIYQMEGQRDHLLYFLKKSATYYYVVALFLGLALCLFVPEALMVLAPKGQAFWDSASVIPFIVFGFIQHGLGYFLGWGITLKNKSMLFSTIMLLSLAINILLNLLLIPEFGIVGAAIATLVSYVAWNFLKLYYSKKHYGLVFELKKLATLTLVWMVIYFIGMKVPFFDDWYLNIPIKIMVLLIFPLSIFSLRIIEWAEFLKLINATLRRP